MDKRYDNLKFEKEVRKLWEDNKVYNFEKEAQGPIFSIDTPPPTVSGTLHTGHIFSYTHTDIIARYKRMTGFNIFYPMGFDDNGLPTEKYVEKIHKTIAKLLKRSDFIKMCLSETEKVEKEFEKLWKSIGLSVDWTKTYSTISEKARKISQLSFIELYKKGLIYRKQEPALYCTTCQTTVAQAELDSVSVNTTFNNIKFETEDGQELIIATTRPELMPACVAIFFHPEDERYKNLEGKNALIPIFNHKVKIIADKKVDPEKGTGLVMCCTFGDQTDIYWYKTYNLPFIQAVGYDGKWTENTGELKGLRVHEARKKVLQLLQDSKRLVEQKNIKHDVSVHERCKQEIEYLILKQWFVEVLKHKENFLDMAEKIDWKPNFMKARYKDWVENLGWDWCISRQRFYGIPFPVWHCQDCGQVILADEKNLPVDPQEMTYSGKKCPKCSGTNIKGDTDIMDTWNTSSLTPFISLDWPEMDLGPKMPMSMRPQAHDIIRTWTFYTIIKAYYHNQDIPWKQIVISGHVLSGKEKISKSKGKNSVPTPLELLKKYPADVIRYWSANGKLGTDTAFSENQLKIGQRLITKLWNAFRFCSDQIKNYEKQSKEGLEFDNLSKWILYKFDQTVESYNNYFEQYNYTLALESAEKFFWQCFCDNYLELIKDQIFNPDNYDQNTIVSTQFVLYEIGFGILQLFAPILPHISEKLYQDFFRKGEGILSIHKTIINPKRYKYDFEQTAELMDKIMKLVCCCRKLKTEKQLSLKKELEELHICVKDKEVLDLLKKEEQLIRGVTKAKEIIFNKKKIDEVCLEAEDDSWVMGIKVD